MNFAQFERAQVAKFAYREARSTGSIHCIKAVCYVLRNRVRAGWGDGTWLHVMENNVKVEGHLLDGWAELDAQDRLLQLIVRDIDDIYQGIASDDTATVVQDALYWHFIDKPVRPWFVQNILRDPQNHPRIGQVGPIALFK